MIQSGVCRSFLRECFDGVHQPGDAYTVALYTSDATLNEHTEVYTSANEATGSGYDAGGIALSGRTVTQSGRTILIDWDDPVWPLVSVLAHGCLIYNATRANRSVAVYNFGQDVQSTAAPYTVILPPPTVTEALVRIA